LQVLPDLPRVSINDALSALRLVLDAPITAIFHEQDSEGFMAFGAGGTSWNQPPAQFGAVATLDEEKAAHVTQVWRLLQMSPNTGRLVLPLRRWESSLHRLSLDDRLIDAWVSLEALLLGGRDGELSYRAAVRLAEFLGKTGYERKAIYDAARISYRWRSTIVHGLNRNRITNQISLEEVTTITMRHLREALLKVLELPGQFDPEKLESSLLGR
jgi:hypothetical protein